jgi:hypothetical protein
MSEFRPSITATTEPSGPPRPRWPTLAAAVVVVALLAGLLWPEPRATGAHVERAAAIREEQGSAWDAAIISFRRDDRPRPARADDMPGQAPLAAIRLAPHVVDGEVAGYALAPGELPPALASAGLRSGDVLTSSTSRRRPRSTQARSPTTRGSRRRATSAARHAARRSRSCRSSAAAARTGS